MIPLVIVAGVVALVWYLSQKNAPAPATPITTSPAVPGATDGSTLPPAATATYTGPIWRRVGRHGHTQVSIGAGQRFRLSASVPTVRAANVAAGLGYTADGVKQLVSQYLAVKGLQVIVYGPNQALPPDWPKPVNVDPINGDDNGPYAWRAEGVATQPATFGQLQTQGWTSWVYTT